MTSLARRIAIGSVVSVCAVVGLASGAVYVFARWQALRVLDTELAEHADRLGFFGAGPRPGGPPGRMPPWPGQRPQFDGPPVIDPAAMPPALRSQGGWVFVEIREADGDALFRSPSLEGRGIDLAALLSGSPELQAQWREAGGRLLRAMRLAIAGHGGRQGFAAIDATRSQAELGRLGLSLLGLWALATALAALAAWWLHRAVIGPLRRLGAGIAAIDAERPAGRVAIEAPVELQETISVLNGLLDRLAGVLAREKAGMVAIAHELRSPISGLRSTMEVAQLTADAGGRELATRCLPTVVAMHGMVVNLLALARIEAGQERIRVADCDIGAACAAAWAVVAPAATARGSSLQDGIAGAALRSSPEQLGIILANLLDNAVSYSPDGSAIAVTAKRQEGGLLLRVSNPVAGPPPDPARVFEPFWRGDEARSAPQHCGLGLPLARRIAGLLGGSLEADLAEGRFTAILRLPDLPA